MKGLILLANYFEDVEALITIDMLRRAKIQIDLVSLTDDLNVTTQSNIKILADYNYKNIDLNDYDYLIIPGGKAVMTTHYDHPFTKEAVMKFNKNNKLIASICAAPSILGKLGLLDNKNYTCFPSFEDCMPKGIHHANDKVVVDGNIITSKAAGTTFEFAYEIIKYLTSEELAKKVLESVYYI